MMRTTFINTLFIFLTLVTQFVFTGFDSSTFIALLILCSFYRDHRVKILSSLLRSPEENF
ncbi:hypothetical protein BDW59DRAFT_148491 [Aspergillus cavernicola]|uniref:Uncharacterized protein n=1 Tax=Aspergillus cavernicola TaxID=176166 RepID=A0ABR4I7G6_9EURO